MAKALDAADETINAAIGSNICVYRLAKRYNRQELGRKIGVSAESIRLYELGKHTISAARLVAIARALNIPVTNLFAVDFTIVPESEQKKMLSIIRNISRISSPLVRNGIAAMIAVLAHELE